MSLFLYLYSMSKFNWWRRHSKHKPLERKNALKGKSFILQQIEHGDYDYSDYSRQAQEELEMCKQKVVEVRAGWKFGPDSLQEKVDEVERKYIKRYNKLMEDHDREEFRLLTILKESLIKETKVDIWDSVVNEGADSLTKFYYKYVELSKVAKSKKI